MDEKDPLQTEVPDGLNIRNIVTFAIVSPLGLGLIVLAKWLLRTGPAIYLFLIPWLVLAVWVAFFRQSLSRAEEIFYARIEKDLGRLDKWKPPGFP